MALLSNTKCLTLELTKRGLIRKKGVEGEEAEGSQV